MAGITMYDTALNDQFPAGAAAYAAYVDGGIGNQPILTHTRRTQEGNPAARLTLSKPLCLGPFYADHVEASKNCGYELGVTSSKPNAPGALPNRSATFDRCSCS
jgi:hypothetical protein